MCSEGLSSCGDVVWDALRPGSPEGSVVERQVGSYRKAVCKALDNVRVRDEITDINQSSVYSTHTVDVVYFSFLDCRI